MEQREVAEVILEKLDEVIQINWTFKEVYIRKIVEALETSTTSSK